MRTFTLSRDTFHILVALADSDRHGYSIMQEVEERTEGAVKLSPSTLYSAIKRLLEEGLIEELESAPIPSMTTSAAATIASPKRDAGPPWRKRSSSKSCCQTRAR